MWADAACKPPMQVQMQVRGELLSLVHFQYVAVGEDDFPQLLSGKSHRRSALGGNQSDGNQISGLDGVAGPAVSAKDARTLRFDRPANNFALGVFYVEINLAVRIGPHEFRHGALDGDRV